MKFGLIVLALVASSGYAFVSQSNKKLRPPVSTALKASKHHDFWMAPAAMAVAGWAVAAQVTFAAPLELAQTMSQDKQAIEEIAPESSATYSNLLLSARVETLDFSMPSYDSGGSSSVPNKPPAFTNPFSDISLPSPSDSSTSTDTKADEKAVAAADKQAAKEAAETKKAEEKAAKEARRKEQMELQKAAVERSKQKDAEAAGTAVPALSVPEFKAPEMPDVKLEMPDIKMPSFKAPEVPEFKAPDMPEFKAPDMSGFTAPKIPEFKIPEFKAPEGFKAPSIPEFKAPDSFKAPQAPSFDVPKAPSFDAKLEMPKFGLPLPSLDGGTTTSEGVVLDSQESRDERAREARSVFLAADDEAKVVEKQARELRNVANEKKKIAKAAKDVACETRWGGKFICLRPFGSGY